MTTKNTGSFFQETPTHFTRNDSCKADCANCSKRYHSENRALGRQMCARGHLQQTTVDGMFETSKAPGRPAKHCTDRNSSGNTFQLGPSNFRLLHLFVVTICLIDQGVCKVIGSASESAAVREAESQYRNILSRKENTTDFNIILPYLSDLQGRFLSSDLQNIPNLVNPNKEGGHNTKSKRSIQNEDVNIAFNVRGEIVLLSLFKTDDLIAPSAILESKEDNVTFGGVLQQDCYYQGHVEHSYDSYVALSTCDGLLGIIRTDEEEYLVQPLPSRSKEGRPHVLKKLPHPKGKATGHKAVSDEVSDKHRRKKRAYGDKYLGIMLVADQSVVDFHGSKKKAKTYLLTLMNIMNSVYRHNTLGVRINVVVARVVFLDSYQANAILYRGNARHTLDRFCKWVQLNRPRNPNDPTNHDHAIYLTRDNLGPAGYAPVTGMCQPDRSCAVTKDDGLTSAFVMAHETGHVFGMLHDGQGNNCDGSGESIMAPLVQSTFSRYYWSSCSAHELKLRFHEYTCLDDNPFRPPTASVADPMGQNWDMDEQCRQEFGEGYGLCKAFHHVDPCQYLWCATHDNPLLCKTKKGPPLPGTECKPGYWCMNERCEPKGTSTVSRIEDVDIHGAWTTWSEWSYCTQTCGGGIRLRSRSCDNPEPDRKSKECEGFDTEHEICNQNECEKLVDVRSELCKKKSPWHNNKHHAWATFQSKYKSNQCKLNCVSVESGEIVVSEDVPDGTPCTYETPYHRCIDGECREFGCDGIQGSKKKPDKCGVCEGTGSDCRDVKGKYKETPKDGYRTVVKLPKGSRNIEIKRRVYSAHFLALKDGKTGKYLLNGKKRQEYSTKDIIAYGSRLVYTNDARTESIKGTGPLGEEFFVMVYPMHSNTPTPVDIDYQFTVSKEEQTNKISGTVSKRYRWKFDHWTECSEECGGGTTHIEYQCRDVYDNLKADAEKCAGVQKPDDYRRECNKSPCVDARWEASPWEECSATCGNSGTQIRIVSCTKNEGEKVKEVSPHFCKKSRKPEQEKPCNRRACPGEWSTEEWSKCSSTCDTGVQTRRVYCDTKDSRGVENCNGRRPPDTKICHRKPCPGTLVPSKKEDNLIGEDHTPVNLPDSNVVNSVLNDRYTWRFDEWTECTRSCGTGTQHIVYLCKDKYYQKAVVESHCSHLEKPDPDLRPCNQFGCPETRWIAGNWSECTKTCGRGLQSRPLACLISHEGEDVATSHAMCIDIEPPETIRECNREIPCPTPTTTTTTLPPPTHPPMVTSTEYFIYRWVSRGWSPCSTTCGEGIETKFVLCVKVSSQEEVEVDSDLCEPGEKPSAEERPCSIAPCVEPVKNIYLWKVGEWEACSVTCGDGGVQDRQVNCWQIDGRTGTETQTNPFNCDSDDEPSSRQDCHLSPCPINYTYSWDIGDWQSCSASCGDDGIQTRKILCKRRDMESGEEIHIDDVSRCSETSKPDQVQGCNRNPCPVNYEYRWSYGDWSRCSASCGDTGVYERRVFCERVDPSTGKRTEVDITDCYDQTKPVAKQPCNRINCPRSTTPLTTTTERPISYKWKTKTWSDCSATCGNNGLQERFVNCVQVYGGQEVVTRADSCVAEEKPEDKQPCNRVACPAPWRTTKWSQCSVTCGTGKQTRDVFCDIPTPNYGIPYSCFGKKPPISKQCQLESCDAAPTTPKPPCNGDKSKFFCKLVTARAKEHCRLQAYYNMCCASCDKFERTH
ncbi:A disintegrin and metalloproteinase with thrombospondin motifs 3 isoform X2 [Lingula anatina]|uniref:A disintegrin and metalloproteinase with thrombospondin motifs 3 isoform X2 n=1 Tax=Lingula anatina TaxID=7574 RepID=A0A1S3HAG8_LINAN|nr:A disintegrin and metalloproteinase with thrombospondin motifs 3 isoform X2 [Lingula anatina]|eukprot:XP_013383070.1 A disintegrin and metalloproteinase with thrombospondin motifs 3 isoform X2 [Lingula anatina]